MNTRRDFLNSSGSKIALLASAIAGASSASAQQSTQLIEVGPGGMVGTIAEAIAIAAPASAVQPFIIRLLPGIHSVVGQLTIPRFVSLIGEGRESTMIDCSGSYGHLRFSGNQLFADFSIRAIRTSQAASKGILVCQGSVRDFYLREITLFLKGGYQAAIYCNSFSTMKLNGVHIWTTSEGVRATGYIYLTDCQVRLTGDATGTPYYGLTCMEGSNAAVRYFVTGGFYGTGYATTNEPGFGGNGYSVVNDGNQPLVVFHIPGTHTPKTLTGTRFQLTEVECYARNDSATSDAMPCNCVSVDGAGIARLFGGVYQSETPLSLPRAWAVVNANFGTHLTNGGIELYGARVTSIKGNASSFGQEAIGTLSSVHDGIQLTNYSIGTYFCDAAAGPFHIRLPANWQSGSPPQGCKLRFIKRDQTTNPVTIRVSGPIVSIEGAPQVTLTLPYEKLSLLFGGGDDPVWYRI